MSIPVPTFVRTFIFLLILVILMPGCISTNKMKSPSGIAAMELKLQSLTTDKRYTYFELTPDGTLSFGGGFNAINKNAQPVMKLSREQLIELQSLISRSNLLTVKVAGPQKRKASKRFHYEMSLRLNSKQNHLIVNDDLVPDLTRLHNHLFVLQAQVRYKLPGIGNQSE